MTFLVIVDFLEDEKASTTYLYIPMTMVSSKSRAVQSIMSRESQCGWTQALDISGGNGQMVINWAGLLPRFSP